VSRGIAPIPDKCMRCDGLISIDDPYLYQHLRQGGTLMSQLTDRRRQSNCVIYGRTLHTYCCIQGLIERGVKPENITLVVPKENCHVEESYDLEDPENNMKQDLPHIYPNAFEDEIVEEKIRGILLYQGVKVMQNA
jgi:hypothetical protein